MAVCPICGFENERSAEKCLHCGENLSQYLKVYYAPDILYNEAVDFINSENYIAAAECLAAASKMKPSDKGILVTLVRVYILQGYYDAALDKCFIILDIFPEDKETLEIVNMLTNMIDVRSKSDEKIEKFLNKNIKEVCKESTGLELKIPKINYIALNIPQDNKPEDRVKEVIKSDEQKIDYNKKLDSLFHRFAVSTAIFMVTVIAMLGIFYYKTTENIEKQTQVWEQSKESIEKINNNLKTIEANVSVLKENSSNENNSLSDIKIREQNIIKKLNAIDAQINNLNSQLQVKQ